MNRSRRWRWIEEDPFGYVVYCGEDSWEHIADEHVAVVPFETGIRTTIADPARVYFDPTSTAMTRRRGNPRAEVVHYVGVGHTDGRYVDHLMIVVVKWLPEGPANIVVGYVATAYLARRTLARLVLRWERER